MARPSYLLWFSALPLFWSLEVTALSDNESALRAYKTALSTNTTTLNLEQAIAVAQQQDPWLQTSQYRQHALEAQSIAAGQLPDPRVSIGVANLPVDSLTLSQEPMTQLKVGVMQMIPRGSSLALKQQQLTTLSAQQPFLRENRKAQVATTVAHLWLEVYRHRQIRRLIEDNRNLFEHLVDVAQSSYTSTAGKTRQQDLVRAQLELTRLDDRLTVIQQRLDISRSQLSSWVEAFNQIQISEQRPNLTLRHPALRNKQALTTFSIHRVLQQHPAIKSLDQKISASSTGIALAKQSYKPQWGVNASYGYRDDDPMGNNRSDFFSVGVSFDVPLMTGNRQDKQVAAAVASEMAMKTEKALKLRTLKAEFEAGLAQLTQLDERYALYQHRLLREIEGQAEAALTAYTNDDGDFAEVVRARIAALNAKIDFLNIQVDQQKAIAQLNYFLVSRPETVSQQTPATVNEGLSR